ncbi:E3 SUMO-protein ligase MMS21 isoform X2 [Selaginella moellendorffii]|uniref:E3 SUMO-protein ligase MMS21 isoform X2 n=1 Tax=Selaginella moellendorffii TaxID=88036 RepID=UPI000D1C323C|nr:E3 SUMO-protein ligase MMS21 isoform X2 [Selaginella moellendorffii]|eukprot:XP_024535081.1 E3 SUMO-protein ligase MMS21 isoform X2 [Selaginella moellendorffii]
MRERRKLLNGSLVLRGIFSGNILGFVGAAPAIAMDRAFDSVDDSTRSLVSDMQSNLVLIKLIAEDVERAARGCDEVKKLDEAVLELLTATDELERHRKAMQALKASYQFTANQPTDFSKSCEAEMQAFPATNPKDHPIYKHFEEAIWNVHNSGVPMPGQEQAEILCTTQAGILNRTCPISGKHVTELENPVRCSECRHIYDLPAARGYIGSRLQSKRCAVAEHFAPKSCPGCNAGHGNRGAEDERRWW